MKFKNVKCVFPISDSRSLCKIECHNYDIEKHYQIYFLNKNKEIVAYFEHSMPFSVEQLNVNSCNLFLLYDISNDLYQVVKMKNFREYDILYTYQEVVDEDEYYAVRNNDVWGFLSLDGVEIVKPQFEKYRCYSEYIAVRKNKKWGFLDLNGNIVIDIKYFRVHDFCGDYAVVHSKEGYFTLIDKKGNVILASNDRPIFNLGSGEILLKDLDTDDYELVKLKEQNL